MKLQQLITSKDRPEFEKSVNAILSQGGTVVPGTLTLSSSTNAAGAFYLMAVVIEYDSNQLKPIGT